MHTEVSVMMQRCKYFKAYAETQYTKTPTNIGRCVRPVSKSACGTNGWCDKLINIFAT